MFSETDLLQIEILNARILLLSGTCIEILRSILESAFVCVFGKAAAGCALS